MSTSRCPRHDAQEIGDADPAKPFRTLASQNSRNTMATPDPTDPKRVTVRTLAKMKSVGDPISMLTAYDYPTAKALDSAGVDVLLVGDSLAMVVQGHETTLPVTMDQMIYHAEMVGRATARAMVVVDLPFPEGQLDISRSLQAAARVLKETRCHAVKLEGGAEQSRRIEALVTAGIPVMAHVGLRPQNVHVEGGYRVGRDENRLVADAKAAEDAGAFAVLIECVTESIGRAITDAIQVPTIGIGAGRHVNGQVLVTNDLIGLTSGYLPKFVRQYSDANGTLRDAATRFKEEMSRGSFPGPKEIFE
ncbi:MAG: 3-methyl-2-oxobutanoate hydroxymethyltransferase [Planctomycetota bacterium]